MIYLKNKDELNKLERLNKMGAEVLRMCWQHIKPGVATLELEEIALKYCADNKVQPAFYGYKGFPHSICVSIDNEVVHGFPSERIIKEGDLVKVDFGLKHEGFYSDAAFTKTVGEVSEIADRIAKTTVGCLYAAVPKVSKYNRLYDISRTIQDHANNAGFAVVRNYTGHGVGFALHEPPKVTNYVGNDVNWKLKPGMVLAIEPILVEKSHEVVLESNGWTVRTKDGGLSAHFEHSVAITGNGPRILSM